MAKDISIEQFCRKYSACPEGRLWVLNNCTSMREVQDKAPLDYLFWVARRVLTTNQFDDLYRAILNRFSYISTTVIVIVSYASEWGKHTEELCEIIRSFTPNFTEEFHSC